MIDDAPGHRQVGPTSRPIFHLHPLLRCNLACAHCYSESSPRASAMLERDHAMEAIRQAHRWGYELVSVSGGEPLLYPWLGEILAAASDLGMGTSVVTNGLLIERSGAIAALQRAGTVAVSVDGMRDSHNAVRGQMRAFDGVRLAMQRLTGAGITFGVSCGVTKANVGELDEIVGNSFELGASSVQLHPIEPSGRAALATDDLVLDEKTMTAFYVLAHIIATEYAGRLRVSIDVVHRRLALQHPEIIYGHEDDPRSWKDALPGHLLGVLVMGARGELMPVSYGFSAKLAIGNVLLSGYECAWRSFLGAGYPALRKLGRQLRDRLALRLGPDVFNPSELLGREAACRSFE